MDMGEFGKFGVSAVERANIGLVFGTRREYVTAWLDDSEYAFESARVRQIRTFDGPFPEAALAGFVVGRIGSAAGSSIPVVDLRLRQGPALVTYSETMLVVVVASTHGRLGIVMDSISNLVDLESSPDTNLRGDGVITAINCNVTNEPAVRSGRCTVYVLDINHIALSAAGL